MQVSFSSLDWDTDTAQVSQIRPNVDLGSDGSDDAQGQGTIVGDTIYISLEVTPEYWSTWTEFDVTGTAISLPITGIITGSEFMEPRVPYTYDVLLTLDVTEERVFEVPLRTDGYSDLDPATPSDFYDPDVAKNLVMVRPVYDESLIPPYSQEQKSFSKSSSSLPLIMGIGTALLIIGLGVSAVWLRNNRSELLEAEMVGEQD